MPPDELQQFFTQEMTELLRLALHLTADTEKAETCLILAMRDCFASTTVSKEWLAGWARRMVVGNAIRLVLGTDSETPHVAGSTFCLPASDAPTDSLRDSVAILQLDDFDRLAFVICVWERYSLLDCALLLRTTPKDVKAAIVRARNQLVPAVRNERVDGGALPLGTGRTFCDE